MTEALTFEVTKERLSTRFLVADWLYGSRPTGKKIKARVPGEGKLTRIEDTGSFVKVKAAASNCFRR
jgi:hypothetical protein